MATLNQGANAQLTINAGEVYRVYTLGQAEIEILNYRDFTSVSQTVILSGANKSYDFGPYERAIKINVQAQSGTTDYNLLPENMSTVSVGNDANGNVSFVINPNGTNSSIENVNKINILTPKTKLRGVAHRGGWPNNSQSGQLLGASMFPVEAGSGYVLSFVGAITQIETSARNGTIQAYVEAGFGSGNWYQATFKNSASGTFITSGSVPDESNNFWILNSDPLPFKLTEPTMLRVVCSAKGGFPCMTNYDGYYEGRPAEEFTIQNSSADDAALQLDQLGLPKINTFLNCIINDGIGMVPRACSSALWSGGTLTLNVPNHSIASSTNNKIVLSGFTNSGAALDGVYSFATSGANALTVSIAVDPGTITQVGVIRLAQSITSATWSGGKVTVTRAAHGRLEGQVVSIRGTTSTGTSINGDFPITAVPTVDTFEIDLATTSGTVTVTNAYMFLKYAVNSADFHLRPFTILAQSNIATQFLAGDSTTHSVDRIQDITRLCGVTQRCVGELFPFIDGSANNEGLSHWLSQPSQVIIRTKYMELYADGITFGYQKNDEDAYATSAEWIAAHDQWWALPVQASLARSPFNTAVIATSRNVNSRDIFSTLEGQIKPTNTRLEEFHRFISGKLNSLYNYIFDYASLLIERNQTYAFKTNNCRNIIFTSTAGGTTVAVDPSTPISPADNRQVVALIGAASGGLIGYVRIGYVSPTKFVALNTDTNNRSPRTNLIAVTGGTGIVGARRYIAYDSGLATSLHENPDAIFEITKQIALRK